VRRLVLLGAGLGVLLASGCARNAFLELRIELPGNAFKEPRQAVVQVVSGDVPFEQEWAGGDAIPSVPLGASPSSTSVSIEGDADNEQKPIRVKVKFCRGALCELLNDDVAPQAWLHLDRAFYVGERTSYTWKIPCIPNVKGQTDPPPACDAPPRTTVPKCKVAGCRSGVTSEYCSGGRHFCE
jgi:hypothetical protein